MSRILATEFPNLDKPPLTENQGLSGPFEASNYQHRIDNFKSHFDAPSQPSFYISFDSWNMLMKGQIKTNEVTETWLPNGYEIYAFVFCIAQPSNNFSQNNFSVPAPNKKLYYPYAYFRIRTIIRQIPIPKSTAKKDSLHSEQTSSLASVLKPKPLIPPENLRLIIPWVETNHIAYVNVIQAIENGDTGTGDCLRFCNEGTTKWIEVKDDVNRWIENVGKPTSILRIEDIVGQHNKHFVQEGVIFGKRRLEEVLGTHPGIRISFALKKRDEIVPNEVTEKINPIQFVFRINPDYLTELPCPIPQAACSNS